MVQVPYGERVVTNPFRDELHEFMLGIFRYDLVTLLQRIDAEGNLKPHLKKVVLGFTYACSLDLGRPALIQCRALLLQV